jgi:hypothetical protein
MLGIDLKPLINELAKFQQTQVQIITLLKENNQLLTQIYCQLGGKIPNSALIEEKLLPLS